MRSKDFRVLVLEVWRDTEDIGVESCKDIYNFKFNGLNINEVMILLGQSPDAAHAVFSLRNGNPRCRPPDHHDLVDR